MAAKADRKPKGVKKNKEANFPDSRCLFASERTGA
tara:strand:+ start:12443 stop:12547 length:105 start_codon:yes stop_codon:yes gene_type:complete